jgi:hypothetical protein
MQSQRDELSPEVAEYLLSIGFGEGDRERMQQLAEPAEFDSYLHVGNLLAVMQSKARLALRRKPQNGPRL